MILLYIPCKNEKEAKSIASVLLEKKSIACANIFPIRSVYEWHGKVKDDSEAVLLLKTFAEKKEEVELDVKALHSYDVPCVICIEADVNKEYLAWMRGSVS